MEISRDAVLRRRHRAPPPRPHLKELTAREGSQVGAENGSVPERGMAHVFKGRRAKNLGTAQAWLQVPRAPGLGVSALQGR